MQRLPQNVPHIVSENGTIEVRCMERYLILFMAVNEYLCVTVVARSRLADPRQGVYCVMIPEKQVKLGCRTLDYPAIVLPSSARVSLSGRLILRVLNQSSNPAAVRCSKET